MGHERVGVVPKTERWKAVLNKLDSLYTSSTPISEIAELILRNVRSRYSMLANDPSVQSSFAFLVSFSHACGSSDARKTLETAGIKIPDDATPLSVVNALKEYIPSQIANTEYGQLAISAAADAIIIWYADHSKQENLFRKSNQFFENCRPLGGGSGFCEIARLFFGKLTERYLNYFLDRAASSKITSLEERRRLQQDVKKYTDSISRHAFETAKITQSFAAGWFNKYAVKRIPEQEDLNSFISHAFAKLKEELRIEEEVGR
jgi:hypothetical protein